MMKFCSCCSHPAEYSVISVVSSVGVSKRLQKCSPAILYCAECLQKLSKHEHGSTNKLLEAVNSAYTALTRRLTERSASTETVERQ
jgi:hypothetical protein